MKGNMKQVDSRILMHFVSRRLNMKYHQILTGLSLVSALLYARQNISALPNTIRFQFSAWALWQRRNEICMRRNRKQNC